MIVLGSKKLLLNHAFYKAILWGSQKKITVGYTSGPKKGNFGINDNLYEGADCYIPLQSTIRGQVPLNFYKPRTARSTFIQLCVAYSKNTSTM